MFINTGETTDNNVDSHMKIDCHKKKKRRASVSRIFLDKGILDSKQMMMSPIPESLKSSVLDDAPSPSENKRFGGRFELPEQLLSRRSTKVSYQYSESDRDISSPLFSANFNIDYVVISPWQDDASEDLFFGTTMTQSNRFSADHYKSKNRDSSNSTTYSWFIKGQILDVSSTDEFRDLSNNIKMFALSESRDCDK